MGVDGVNPGEEPDSRGVGVDGGDHLCVGSGSGATASGACGTVATSVDRGASRTRLTDFKLFPGKPFLTSRRTGPDVDSLLGHFPSWTFLSLSLPTTHRMCDLVVLPYLAME